MTKLVRVLIRVVIFAAIAGVIGFLGIYLFGQLYLRTENRNFARIREKSKLNCETMPFHCAARDKDLAALSRLKEAGRDVNAKDNWGMTALMFAIAESSETVPVLLKLGSNPNLPDDQGNLPIGLAMQYKNFDVMKQLFAAGVDPNATLGTKKMTLLSEAVTARDVEAVTFLVLSGARSDVKDGYGYTPCDRVKMYHTEAIFPFCR